MLPHVLLAHELVDLVVEVADLRVRQRRVLDLADFAADFLEDLTAPFFAGGDGGDGCDGAGTAGAAEVEDAEVGGLGGAEAEEHRLRFFAVAGLREGGGGRLVGGRLVGLGIGGCAYHGCGMPKEEI